MARSCRRRFTGLAAAALGVLCFGLGACQDIDWDFERLHWRWDWWNKPTRRPIRPSGQGTARPDRNAEPAPAESRVEPAPRTAEGPGPAGQPFVEPRRPGVSPAASIVAPSAFYQLILLSERGPAAGPGRTKYVRLKHVSAEAASKALAWLYAPIGRPGQETRRTLIYQSGALWAAAAEFAPNLDVPVIDEPPPTLPIDPREAFAKAIGLFAYVYRMNPPQPVDLAKLDQVNKLLNVTATANAADPCLRWAAAMLAGQIQAEAQFDFQGAQQSLLVAQGQAGPETVELMMTLFARAEAYSQDGQTDQARKLYQQIVNQFPRFRDSEVYRRAQKAVQAGQRSAG